jgi:hypothetical protein
MHTNKLWKPGGGAEPWEPGYDDYLRDDVVERRLPALMRVAQTIDETGEEQNV